MLAWEAGRIQSMSLPLLPFGDENVLNGDSVFAADRCCSGDRDLAEMLRLTDLINGSLSQSAKL